MVPFPVIPTAPALVRPPFHRDGWVYEEKVDGWRMLAYKDGRRVRLISRNAVDHTHRFRELAAALAKLKPDVVVLDGEVAVYDENLVSRFHLLGDPDTGILCTPPVFIAFDVLQRGHRDLRRRPLAERRRILEELVDDVDQVLPCRRLQNDGAKAWHEVDTRRVARAAATRGGELRGGSRRTTARVELARTHQRTGAMTDCCGLNAQRRSP